MSHTPLPWKRNGMLVFKSGENGANICAVGSPRASGYVEHKPLELGDPDTEEAYANAQFIVLAANAHDDLVKAAEYALEYIEADRDFDEEPLEPGASMQDSVIQELRDAVEKAKVSE